MPEDMIESNKVYKFSFKNYSYTVNQKKILSKPIIQFVEDFLCRLFLISKVFTKKKSEEIVSEVPLNLSIVNTMFILIYSVYSHLLMDLSKYKNHKNKMKE